MQPIMHLVWLMISHLEYNKARQAAITNEILDIVGGASALEATLKAKAAAQHTADVQAILGHAEPSTNGSAKKAGKSGKTKS